MRIDWGRIFITITAVALAVVAGAAIFTPDLPLYLRLPIYASLYNSITSEFSWTPPAGTSAGTKTLTLVATDTEGVTTTKNVTINVAAPAEAVNNDSGSGDGDSGGGGGDGGGDESDSTPARPDITKTYQVEIGHRLEGDHSGIVPAGNGQVAKIAHGRAILEGRVSVPRNNYWLNIRVRHDQPGPVDMAVYLNGRAWKTVRLTKADNNYYTHQVGLLRDFSGGTIRFRLLNDTYHTSRPTDEDTDRNLFVDWWQLTTSSAIPKAPSSSATTPTGGGLIAGTRSTGWSLIPGLNQYIREELGAQYVRFDVWQYYAWRLTARTGHRANISSPSHLRNVMRYWRGVNPERPYGQRI